VETCTLCTSLSLICCCKCCHVTIQPCFAPAVAAAAAAVARHFNAFGRHERRFCGVQPHILLLLLLLPLPLLAFHLAALTSSEIFFFCCCCCYHS
jgi:hypothetical protein